MISVCIATYNGEKFIYEQIKSILKQLSEGDEIIISDDGSQDNTIDIVKSFKDDRIKIFYNDGKHGFVGNFENALKKTSGDYIFLSDQDDVWLDDKVKIIIEYLKRYDFVVHDCYTTDENLNIIDNSRFFSMKVKKGFWHLMVKTRYLGCCMAFNKYVKDACLPFPKRDDLIEHDLWIAAVSEKYFKTELIRKQLIYYRRHASNTSDGGAKSNNTLFKKIYRRLYRLKAIFKLKL